MRLFVICFFLILIIAPVKAQEFGGNPSSLKWKQINTESLRLIFPEGNDSIAFEIADNIRTIAERQRVAGNSIGNKLRSVNLLLQTNTTISNGYVALGPWKTEFYMMPPQNAFELGAQNWATLLSNHEWRHVQQYSNFNTGLSKAVTGVFGEYAQSLVNSAAIPDWFFEGDAVYNETVLSEQGRGRLPFFFNDFRSLSVASKQYSYMQLRNGSFRNFIPDHYRLGYLLINYGTEKYGNEFWKNVTQNAAAFKPLIYPFQHAVKKYSGISFNAFTKNALQYYVDEYRKSKNKNNGLQWLTTEKKNEVTNYLQPYLKDDTTLIVLKSGNKVIPAFIKLNSNNTEERIAVKDISIDDYYSYNNGKIVYAAFQPDTRWANNNYSIIKLLDVETGKSKDVKTHTQYFSPDIAHNGKNIVAVEMKQNLKSSLVLLDTLGNPLRVWKNNDNLLYSQPKFSSDDQAIFVIVRNDKGYMGLERRDILTGVVTTLIPMSNTIIGFPVVQDQEIIYTRTAGGNDEIWAFSLKEGNEHHLASAATGLYQGFRQQAGVITAVFTSGGYRLAKIVADEYPLYEGPALKQFNKKVNELDSILPKTETYAVSDYKKLTGFFNFHSWVPSLNPPDYAVTVYGENVLNTFQSQVYYQYNTNERFNKIGYTGIYGGWYVQPYLDLSQTFNRTIALNADTTIRYNETKTAIGLQLPLNFTQGKKYQFLNLSASYNYANVQYTGIGKQLFQNANINYVETRITYRSQIQKALQFIYPHFGYSLLLQSRNAFSKVTANQFLASANLYLPGVLPNHSIVLNAAFQARDTSQQYYYTNNFAFSRGYESLDFSRLWKYGINYHFPVCYPDWGFANIVFFNRIRLNAFYDHTTGRSLRLQKNYSFNSTGAELYFDTRWWNQQPLTFGVRYSHLLNENYSGLSGNRWEFILPIIILN